MEAGRMLQALDLRVRIAGMPIAVILRGLCLFWARNILMIPDLELPV
jgi:hypothetical protein